MAARAAIPTFNRGFELMIRRLALIATLTALACSTAAAEPTRPDDDALVLATVPAGQSSAAASELRLAESDLARNPRNLALALRTARLAIEQGRTWSDPRRYGQAEAALKPWWSETEPPEEVRVLRAVIRQALHDFDGALADLDAIVETSPRNAQARLTRAFVRMVVGEIAGAAEDCRNLPRAAGLLPAAVCRARVAALSGSGPQAHDGLALLLARDSTANETMRRFAFFVLADIAEGIGRHDDASRYFNDAAALGEPDVPLLAATSDHLLDRGRPADVLKLLDGKGNADVLILRRAIAARLTNDERLAEWSATLNERFAAARKAGVNAHLREEARFRIDVEGDSAAALPLAIENWSIQKEIADAQLLLECALAAGRPDAAADAIRFIRSRGLSDSRVAPLVARLESKQ
jgi:hypothetical protein